MGDRTRGFTAFRRTGTIPKPGPTTAGGGFGSRTIPTRRDRTTPAPLPHPDSPEDRSDRPGPDQASGTLASLLHADRVPIDVLYDRFPAVLELIRGLLGVFPNSFPYMAIWPPAFRTCNVMVPNFLNVPFSLWGVGSARKEFVGLAMYVASRTAECAYCSAHGCSFALRRGASPETIARALGAPELLTPKELATVSVASSLSRVPCDVSAAQRTELERHFRPREAEWIVFVVAMMGFLNKYMNGLGVELEQSTYSEVLTTIGPDWSVADAAGDLDPTVEPTRRPDRDTIGKQLRLLPYFPAALKLDGKWQSGVPRSWPAAGKFLRELTGHDFPVLGRVTASRCVRTIATMLRENLDPETSVLGLEVKVLAGMIYATVIEDEALGGEIRAVGRHFGVTPERMAAAVSFGSGGPFNLAVDSGGETILEVARAASPSPARVTPELVERCRQENLPPGGIVELICWLSVLQMLHRLSAYFPLPDAPVSRPHP